MKSFDAKSIIEQEVATLLGGRVGSLVDGEIIAGDGAKITLQDPATGDALLEYASAGAGLVAQAAGVAVRAQREWQALSGAERGRRLWAMAPLLRQAAENLARLESAQTGKPLRDARAEVARVAEMAEYWAGWCDKIEGRIIPVPSGHTVMVRREALGVVLAITPWNAPIFTAGWNVFPALAAGNAVLLKPSEFTPLTSLALGLLAEQAGLPRGVFQVLAGPGQGTGAALLATPEVVKVVFVGGVAAGRAVAATAAARGVPTVLELGGKSANIVFEDADFASAIQGAQQAIYAGSGQSCVAGSRLLVHMCGNCSRRGPLQGLRCWRRNGLPRCRNAAFGCRPPCSPGFPMRQDRRGRKSSAPSSPPFRSMMRRKPSALPMPRPLAWPARSGRGIWAGRIAWRRRSGQGPFG